MGSDLDRGRLAAFAAARLARQREAVSHGRLGLEEDAPRLSAPGGSAAATTGGPVTSNSAVVASIDQIVADTISKGAPFRSIELGVTPGHPQRSREHAAHGFTPRRECAQLPRVRPPCALRAPLRQWHHQRRRSAARQVEPGQEERARHGDHRCDRALHDARRGRQGEARSAPRRHSRARDTPFDDQQLRASARSRPSRES